MKHTATPWVVDDANAGDVAILKNGIYEYIVSSDCSEFDQEVEEANAKRIVHCVNTYPALVEALESIKPLVYEKHFKRNDTIEMNHIIRLNNIETKLSKALKLAREG